MPRVDATSARLTQAERSAGTKARLLDATIDCLVELGWAGTSTTEVVRRAGVSRGAQVHHYPTKEDLVLAAIEHVLNRRVEEFRAAFESLPPGRRTVRDAFELMWSQCFGPTFEAWLELAVASRRSPLLHARVVELSRQFATTTTDQLQALFPDVFADRELAQVSMRLTFCVLDGLAISRLGGATEAEQLAVRETFHLLTAPFTTTDPGATP